MKYTVFAILLSVFITGTVWSESSPDYKESLDYAQVEKVSARLSGNVWNFSVSVRHKDEGWKHYADAWQIVDPETDEIISERILQHPHDSEQPFTRSLSNIEIAETAETVTIRAKCNVHGFGGYEMTVHLIDTDSNPPKVEVIR